MRYLIITYLQKAGGQIDEQLQVTKNLKDRDIQMSNCIMDFKERKVVKCMVEGQVISTDWDKLYTYYAQIYPSIIQRLDIEATGTTQIEIVTDEVPSEETPPETPSEETPPETTPV